MMPVMPGQAPMQPGQPGMVYNQGMMPQQQMQVMPAYQNQAMMMQQQQQ